MSDNRTYVIKTIKGKQVVMTKDRACCTRHIWVRIETRTVMHCTENLDGNLNLFVRVKDNALVNGVMDNVGEMLVDYDKVQLEHLTPYLEEFLS